MEEKDVRTIIFLKGLPGSGKTTWAKKICAKNNKTKRVNKDDIRDMLDDGKYSSNNEKLVLAVRDIIIKETLQRGYDIIVDDTNFNKEHMIDIRDIAKDCNENFDIQVNFIVKEFNEDLETCIKRDLLRRKSVGKDVIVNMYNNYIKPSN